MLGCCLMGCGDEESQEKKALTDITVEPESLSMIVGTKRVITATPIPADADDVIFQWVSDDESIATVSTTGEVEAKTISATGTNIIVSCGKIRKRVHVTVTAEVIALESIAVEKGDPGVALTAPYEVEIPAGEFLKLTPKPVPANATQTNFGWTTDPTPTDILSVGADGVVSALKKGEVYVVVTESESGKTARIKVTVTGELIALILPEDGATLAELSTQFPYRLEWSGVQDYSGGYTIKIADSEDNLATTQFTLDAGTNTSYDLTEAVCAGLLNGAQVPKDDNSYPLYWTVAPTVATPGIVTEARSINVIRFANIPPKTYWTGSVSSELNDNAAWEKSVDGIVNTFWAAAWGQSAPHDWTVDFGKKVTVSEVTIYSRSDNNFYPVQIKLLAKETESGGSSLRKYPDG